MMKSTTVYLAARGGPGEGCRLTNPAQGGGPGSNSMTDWRKRYERDRKMGRAFLHVACLLIPLR
jgi:hypothetical protein